MYLTVKDIKQTYKPITNVIDSLFAGETEIIIPNFTENKLVRTKTYKVDSVNSEVITFEQFLLFTALVNATKADHPNPEDEYISFRIPKKTHGFREINAPKPELKSAQKEIANALQNYLHILSHDSAWAYVEGRDVVNAMKEHTNNKSRWYLKLDLHDFFGSCNKEFIISQLKKIYPFADTEHFGAECINETLNSLTDVAILNGGLPQGTPLSPILTNLIMVDIDYRINKLLYKLTKDNKLFKQKYIYTRYADDIIISAKNKFEYAEIVKAINDLLEDTPLELNNEKTRFGSNSGRNWNLGIMCNSQFKTTVGYRRKHALKSYVHNYLSNRAEGNLTELDDLYWLQGQLSWLQNVEPEYFNGFIEYINKKYNTNLIKDIILDIKSFNN